MSRLSPATRDNVPEDQLELFEELFQKNNKKVPPYGPVAVLAHVPTARELELPLRDYLRFKSSLSHDVVELVIMVSARELDCQFLWNSHVAAARKALGSELVDALRDRTKLPALSDKHLGVINYGREFFRTHRVSAGTFSLAKQQLEERGVVEMTLLFGSYCTMAALLNCTDAELPPTRTEPVLPIC